MGSKIRWALASASLAALLSGCADVSEAKHTTVEPYSKEETAVSGHYRVKLAKSAAERLEVRIEAVTQARAKNGSVRKVIPYAAIIYDLDGVTWAYTNPEPLLYVREGILIDYIDGDQAFLLQGPKLGTPVVIVGAAELYGIEFGLGK